MSIGLIIFGGCCILGGIAVWENSYRCYSPQLRGPHRLLAATSIFVGLGAFIGGGWFA